MSSAGTLWSVHGVYKAKTVRAVAAFAGITIDVPTDYVHFEDNEKPDFPAKFPFGKIPAWEGKDGFTLFEGAAIARYLAGLVPSSGLLGQSPEDAALVDQWVHMAESDVNNYTDIIDDLVSGEFTPYSKSMHAIVSQSQLQAFKILEAHISSRTFFVGDRITLADITIAGFIQRACAFSIDTALRAKLPNLIRHMETIINQPVFAGIYEPTPVLQKALTWVPPPKK